MVNDIIRYIDMFSGIGGFREGLTRAGGFKCVGHCEIDTNADRSYRALFDTSGEWFCADARDADPAAMPGFELLCGGFPFTETAGTSLVQVRAGTQGERVYSPSGVSCTLSAGAGGFGGRTGLYDVAGIPIKEATKKGYKLAYPGNSIDLSYATQNTRRGRVGRGVAQNLTTQSSQGTLEPCFIDMNEAPEVTGIARCLTAKQNGGIRRHRREASGVLSGGRIRRLTPRECLRLQGWRDDQIDKVLAIQSDNQVYRQAGNGVTVTVVEALGRRIAAADAELRGVRDGA